MCGGDLRATAHHVYAMRYASILCLSLSTPARSPPCSCACSAPTPRAWCRSSSPPWCVWLAVRVGWCMPPNVRLNQAVRPAERATHTGAPSLAFPLCPPPGAGGCGRVRAHHERPLLRRAPAGGGQVGRIHQLQRQGAQAAGVALLVLRKRARCGDAWPLLWQLSIKLCILIPSPPSIDLPSPLNPSPPTLTTGAGDRGGAAGAAGAVCGGAGGGRRSGRRAGRAVATRQLCCSTTPLCLG